MGRGHQHLHKRQDDGVFTTIDGTVFSVTYQTASPTFDGVIGGYTTLTGGDDATATSASAARTSNGAPSAATGSSQTTSDPANDGIPDAATLGLPSTSSRSSQSTASRAASAASGTVAAATASATAGSSSSDGGMSTGAKAGLAIGIIAGIGLLAAILLFCIGRKKKQKKEQESQAMDEKKTFGASKNAINMQQTSPRSAAAAPRLSIRPMSRNLLGDFGFGGANRRSAGNMLNNVPESAPRNASPAPQHRPQSPPENPFADPKNPFADPERGAPVMAAPAAVPRKPAAPVAAPLAPPQMQNQDRIAFTGSWPTAPSGYEAPVKEYEAPVMDIKPEPTAPKSAESLRPFSDELPIMGTTPSLAPSSPAPSSAAFGGAAVAASAAAAVAMSKKSESRPEQRHPEPREQQRDVPMEQKRPVPREQPRDAPQDMTSSPVPAPSPAFAAAGGPPSSPNPSVASSAASQGGNVYRVLMDFAPSMDDELELKAGSLVRLLHEYDDGWALCIKLDRSHQGVVPRTCLAAKPSKPKPSHLGQYARGPGQNGRDSPMGRPQSPAGDPRGRNSPAMGGRPMSPGMGRPMSPGMNRPMSPAGRPMSPGMNRPMSPANRQMRPQSPAGNHHHRGPPPHRGGPPPNGRNRPMSPAGGFNQAPRPLSPGPMRSPGMPPPSGSSKRSQSPGPYGAAGPLPMPGAPQRRRSNSASAMNFQDRRMSPPGPSKLGQGRAMSPMGMAI